MDESLTLSVDPRSLGGAFVRLATPRRVLTRMQLNVELRAYRLRCIRTNGFLATTGGLLA